MKGAVQLRTDPGLFGKIILGVDLWRMQREILTAVGQHSRVVVKACHASGKSFAIAIAALWWLTAHRDGIVVTTAPTWLQVEKVIWAEIKSAVLRSQLHGKLRFPMPTQTELRLGPQNYAIGLSTDDSSRFQGFHSGHVLIVLDEAPGVRAEVYEAVEGIRAGGQVRVLALGNPTVAGGPFYDAFTSGRASWRTITINAFDTPNLEGLPLETLRLLPQGLSENEAIFHYQPRPYLVTRRWVYEKLWEWGERGIEMRLVIGGGSGSAPRIDSTILKATARARRWFDDLVSGRAVSMVEIGKREGVGKRYVSRMIRLAFLSPAIVERIAEGRQPPELTAQFLSTGRGDLPLSWSGQEKLLGFADLA
jgi:hypothetical protein